MRRSYRRLAWTCIVVIAATGCSLGGGDEARFSLEEVETAFAAAGESLVRQETGSFRVSNDESHGCEEVRARDFRISITICSTDSRGPLLMRFIPTQPPREFHSTDELLRFLKVDTKGITPLLIVDPGNITLTYVGRDPERVEMIDRALTDLLDRQ